MKPRYDPRNKPKRKKNCPSRLTLQSQQTLLYKLKVILVVDKGSNRTRVLVASITNVQNLVPEDLTSVTALTPKDKPIHLLVLDKLGRLIVFKLLNRLCQG